MTKVRIPGGTSVLLHEDQIPSLSQVLSIGNDGGGKQIKNIGDPTQNQDAVTLNYLNSHGSTVSSVFGRSGAVVAQTGDYSYSQISGHPTLLSQFTNDVGFLTSAVTLLSGTANQISASASTGSVTLSFPNAIVFPGTWVIGTLAYSDTGILWSSQSSTNSYNQVIVQNSNNGSSASTNYIVSNDQGTASTKYGEFGMNSSGFTGSGAWNIANAVYLDAISDDLAIGTLGNKTLHFFTNSATTDNYSITGSGVHTWTVPVNGSLYTSTWTAGANNQNAIEFAGTVTSRNIASDNFRYLVIDPTLTRNAGNPATQTADAVLINPTFSNSPTTQNIFRLQNAGTDRATFSSDGSIVFSSSNGAITTYQFVSNSGSAVVNIGNGAVGSKIIQTTSNSQGMNWYGGSSASYSFQFATLNAFGGTSTNLFFDLQPSLNYSGATTNTISMLNFSHAINCNANSTTITGIDYRPTETTMTNVTHYFIRNRSTTALSGFGVSAPTAILDLVGSLAASSSFRIRNGTAPTSPNDGDMWYDGTNVKFRIGSTTKTFTLT